MFDAAPDRTPLIRAARAVNDGRPAAVAAFDDALRCPRRLNPGTTADVVAAALYILLRGGDLLPRLLPAVASS